MKKDEKKKKTLKIHIYLVYSKKQVYSLPFMEICHQDENQLAVLNL